MKDIFETISKLRLIESTQFVSEELTPAEQQELDSLAKELEPEMGRIPELDALLLQHKKLASGGQAAQPAAGGGKMLRLGSSGPEVEKLQKDLGIQPADGKFGPATEKAVRTFQQTNKIQVDGIVGPETRAAIEKSQAAGQDDKTVPGQKANPADDTAVNKGGKSLDMPAAGQAAQPGKSNMPPSTPANPKAGTVPGATQAIPTGAPVNPANPGGVSSKMTITPDQAQAVLDNGSERDIAAFGGKERLQQLAGVKPAAPATPPAAGQAAQPAAPAAPGTTTTSTTKSQVSGNIRMGKPDGPITYNGKTVNPSDPDYGAASQALMNVYNKKNNRVNWANKVSGNSTAPVQGPTNAPIDRDF